MKLHWVRPNDVDITACGKDSSESVHPLTYLHAEAKNWLRVATKISQAYVCKKCERACWNDAPTEAQKEQQCDE